MVSTTGIYKTLASELYSGASVYILIMCCRNECLDVEVLPVDVIVGDICYKKCFFFFFKNYIPRCIAAFVVGYVFSILSVSMEVARNALVRMGDNVCLNVTYHVLNIGYGIFIRPEIFFFDEYSYQLIEIFFNLGGK